MKSEFMTWFVSQHGERLKSGMPNHSDQQLRDLVQAGKVAERILGCRELWDEKQTSALYAWNAANSEAPNWKNNPVDVSLKACDTKERP